MRHVRPTKDKYKKSRSRFGAIPAFCCEPIMKLK